MFSVNLIFDKTLMMQFCYFVLQKSAFLGYKCVSIQNSTWILLHSAAAQQHVAAHSADSNCAKIRFTENTEIQPEPRFRGYSMNTLNVYRRRPWLSSSSSSSSSINDNDADINQSINQSIYLQKQAASETHSPSSWPPMIINTILNHSHRNKRTKRKMKWQKHKTKHNRNTADNITNIW